MPFSSFDVLINEMVRNKAVFDPSKESYLRYTFSYAVRVLEHYEKPFCYIEPFMKRILFDDLQDVIENYELHDDIFKVYVPDRKNIPSILDRDFADNLWCYTLNRLDTEFGIASSGDEKNE